MCHWKKMSTGIKFIHYSCIKLRLLKCVHICKAAKKKIHHQTWRQRNWLVQHLKKKVQVLLMLMLVNWQGYPILTGNSNVCFFSRLLSLHFFLHNYLSILITGPFSKRTVSILLQRDLEYFMKETSCMLELGVPWPLLTKWDQIFPSKKEFFILKEIKKAETNNNKKREPKKKSVFVRNGKEQRLPFLWRIQH